MSDQRPSENTDDYPKFPALTAAFGDRSSTQPTFEAQIQMAAKLIEDADEVMDDWRGNSDPNGEALMAATQAVAMATITLAQQQRIANLIAYASHRVDHNDATAARNAPALVRVLADMDYRIREGLGL